MSAVGPIIYSALTAKAAVQNPDLVALACVVIYSDHDYDFARYAMGKGQSPAQDSQPRSEDYT